VPGHFSWLRLSFVFHKENTMNLLLRRDQKPGMLGLGKVAFILDVRAEIGEDEKAAIKKYKLGDTVLYERIKADIPAGFGAVGLAAKLVTKMLNLTISVNDLTSGKRIEVKDIVEMIAVEEQIKEAAHTFMAVLAAARSFGGEDVITIS
jgi:hypothetical protein